MSELNELDYWIGYMIFVIICLTLAISLEVWYHKQSKRRFRWTQDYLFDVK